MLLPLSRLGCLGDTSLIKEIRNVFYIDEGTPLDISTKENAIIIKKYEPDRLEERVREMQNILNQQIDEIGLEKAMQIEKSLNEIQKILQ